MKTKYVTIEVMNEHIEKGEPEDPCNCPVALALSEKTGLVCEVYPDSIRVGGNLFDKCAHFKAPASVTKFVNKFDGQIGKVKPFSFKLPLTNIKIES